LIDAGWLTVERSFVDGLVSVIIPVYNAERYLESTLDSVFNQTYKDIEIILVDDCSADNSAEIIKSYRDRYPNVIYRRQEYNMGAAVARNTGIEIAKGRYIAFLDSDDLWLPDKTEKQLMFMKERNIAFCFTAYSMFTDDQDVITDKIKIKPKVEYNDLLKKTYIATPTVIIDRYLIGNKPMPLRRTGQDYAYWMLLLRQVDAYGIDEPLVRVRRRQDSLSKNKLQNIVDIWEVQTGQEKLSPIYAAFNVGCYIFNAVIKRYFRG